MNDDYEALPPPPRRWLGLLGAVALALALYYPVGMIWVHRIDADPDFTASAGEALI